MVHITVSTLDSKDKFIGESLRSLEETTAQ